MHKITDEKYRLPSVEALAGMGVMDTGTTEPMKIRGVDSVTGERGQYVVKYIKSSRMSEKSSCRELLGAWMARELEINVIEPVIINITREFAETLLGENGYHSALKSVGLNFGSVYEAGYMELVKGSFKLQDQLLEQAKMIFMFDMFVANADRGAGKPNVITNSDNFLVFDHELAFSFADLLSFARNPEPWTIGLAEKYLYESHLFYPYLRGADIDFTAQTEKLTLINSNFWNRVNEFVPTEWRTDEIEDIKTHTEKIIANRNIFSNELTKILMS